MLLSVCPPISSSILIYVNPNQLPHLLLKLQQPPLLQILRDLLNRLFHALLITADINLRVLRGLIRAANTRELWNLTRARKLVQALGIAGLSDLERQVDKDLDELEGRVVALDFGVQGARGRAVGGEGGDEGCDCDCGGVGEELCDLGVR